MRAFAAVVAVGLSALLVLGCKQGEGERCQVTSDCEDGLICNEATSTCLESSTGTGTDGGIDAVSDAAIDAAVDLDATPAVDAAIDAP